MRDRKYDAGVIRESHDYARGTVRLLLWRREGLNAVSYLCEDGNWLTGVDGDVLDERAGLILPAEAVEAIAAAIQEFQGHASHADTEARVLREWLVVERARVDRAVDQILRGPR
jgi:hypothetical protein